MNPDIRTRLDAFVAEKKFKGKGPLCVALVMTQHARSQGLPLAPDALLTEGGGQVLGLGKSAVQSILNRHGITRVLASEGGRTSRGSIGNMREYVGFLNRLAEDGAANLDEIEGYWIERVHEFFAAKPFKIRLDASRSLRIVVRDVLVQAEERQKTTPGMYYVGGVLQHLVGANLIARLAPARLNITAFPRRTSKRGGRGISSLATLQYTLRPRRGRLSLSVAAII